jgi:hypothetical protein
VIADITTSVTTFDEPRLLSAITRQQYDYQLRNATLALVLSLAAPLRTLSLASVTPPSGITIVQSGALNNALCGDAFNATCQQTYTFGVDPGVQCQLDGVYAFTFTVGCHPSVANTPQCPDGDDDAAAVDQRDARQRGHLRSRAAAAAGRRQADVARARSICRRLRSGPRRRRSSRSRTCTFSAPSTRSTAFRTSRADC